MLFNVNVVTGIWLLFSHVYRFMAKREIRMKKIEKEKEKIEKNKNIKSFYKNAIDVIVIDKLLN